VGNTDWIPAEIDTETPSAARLYDYYLGGGYHFESDRKLAQRIYQALPDTPHLARVNRAFLRRAAQYCATQGVDQFLDIGCGLPTTGAVHEVVQAVNPNAKVVYVDNEPVAVAHSELILQSNENATVLQGDLRKPETVLDHAETRRMLDLTRPVAVLTTAVMHFVSDEANPAALIARYRAAMAPGSYLVLSHATADASANVADAVKLYENSQNPGYLRTKAQVAAMLADFDLVEPGVVFVPEWRPESPEDAVDPERSSFYGVVGRRGQA
jgi:SAM-dependent methyltransferase